MRKDAKTLSKWHWQLEDFTERMLTKEWQEIMLRDDKIVFRGEVRQLVARNIGWGICEVYKASKEAHPHD